MSRKDLLGGTSLWKLGCLGEGVTITGPIVQVWEVLSVAMLLELEMGGGSRFEALTIGERKIEVLTSLIMEGSSDALSLVAILESKVCQKK
jgi:hypothetical protein